ncbi:hypothetical protein I3843_01G210900 [Carya illinoinensis]|uniref:Pentatricopeptide repeat-containing protein n=1 Tax=Carya illinoinensis TaxID=32201 RepID=A0A922G9L2_CARIL|nr:pentatricopeptide repeat-containing protein At1g77405-like [Carya illinoinensis]KAG6733305.1 hypothetical protein I3842_01G219900 [Carya illinoinensis]KAG7997429.1 hypothetical protein I3843_01G210900 [Carya illinoinensis]
MLKCPSSPPATVAVVCLFQVHCTLQLFDKLCEKRLGESVIIYGALIDGLCKTNEIGRALYMHRRMVKAECKVNELTYDMIIDAQMGVY